MRNRATWPRSLGGRAMLVLVAAVVVLHLGSMMLYREAALDATDRASASQLAGRVATAREAVAARPPDRRDAAAHTLSSESLTLRWNGQAMVDDTTAIHPRLRLLRRDLLDMIPGLGRSGVRVDYGGHAPPGDAHLLVGAVQLPDGSFLNFSLPLLGGSGPALHGTLLSTTLMAFGVALVSLLLVRSLISPLRELARAANAIGHGTEVRIAENGPREVNQVARAFNDMQDRIRALVDERTQALAAVSHDLRTSITRLRLRAGFLEDAEAQAAIDVELDEMDAMIDSVLTFLRGDSAPEVPRSIDISALLATLVNAASDAGRPTTFDGPSMVFMTVRPLSVKRAFANLIENALSYGGSARVTLSRTPEAIRVTIDDDGPGMTADEIKVAFEPFRRLDTARNRGTGGFGLGLAIVRQAVEREGGTVVLATRVAGGLRAEVILPLVGDGSKVAGTLEQPRSAKARVGKTLT